MVFDSIWHTRFVSVFVYVLCVFLLYHLALKPINPKVPADIQSYFDFNVYACMYVEQLFFFLLSVKSYIQWDTGRLFGCYRLIHRPGVS